MVGLVSIVTPSYNSAKYITETIQSVQKQTYQNWEWMIIDDGSTDNTVALVEVFAKKDTRIKLIPLKFNAGPSKARNIGINKIKGEYMTFLDADDIWFPDFIENSIKTIQSTKIPFVFSSYKRSDEDLNFIYSDFIVPQRVNYYDILKSNSISCLTAFLDISVLGKKQMPEIKKRQDMGLWLQYLKEIPFAYGIQEPKAIYRIRKHSLSRNKKRLIKYQWQFYRDVENLSVLSSVYYMFQWMYRGILKYKN
ncbi:glycosyltransferase family 2 protein [Aestuariibaculum sp. M13]|uniref:glycosyltransferase family 2 protein n=1 Tax=Aestuariibaculum sp. M13 TaxID=2967132 RepID=UPI002159E423|nr:glycosyltransferase family 2 protein [Aestuariibaculum sp. M13]MCR8667194.1 glycosyltransferase family 2 protein [Aestuariibaculum sp. M13]